MSDYLPQSVRTEMARSQPSRTQPKSRRTVRVGNEHFVILRHWDTGFALDAANIPPLPGRVDLYEGDRHLCQALVVRSQADGSECVFEVKYTTPVSTTQPAVDFVRDAPGALL